MPGLKGGERGLCWAGTIPRVFARYQLKENPAMNGAPHEHGTGIGGFRARGLLRGGVFVSPLWPSRRGRREGGQPRGVLPVKNGRASERAKG